MQFIEWTTEMSVGAETLDGHHRMIIDCLNRLHPLLDAEGNDAEVKAVVATLEDFVLVHFSEEEQEMKRAGYPDWRAHKELHDRMYDVVFALKSDVERGDTVDGRRLFELIENWLVTHILGEDRKYVPFVATHAAAPLAQWKRSNGREV
ncbi:bacteriohemerythrin [Magnetospirillum sp. UT-4]|uniref:bacteriohemerythrin n=1 Tax=Magnetospirillum sp. UT-4 TaxID=2681467 RepID=UPI00137DECDF|nr:bacteriohemerythrin [Magnetospirillum sp. UT-4]CAA7618874.1 putative hemerythrin-like, metal-binding [Magnetospirillum sp. UT-4]